MKNEDKLKQVIEPKYIEKLRNFLLNNMRSHLFKVNPIEFHRNMAKELKRCAKVHKESELFLSKNLNALPVKGEEEKQG